MTTEVVMLVKGREEGRTYRNTEGQSFHAGKGTQQREDGLNTNGGSVSDIHTGVTKTTCKERRLT